MKKYEKEKNEFFIKISEFVNIMRSYISTNNEWNIKGFIDIFENIYTISNDTKIISKLLELHLFPYLFDFAEKNGYNIELATYQNWYPDLTFVSKEDSNIKFAVDLKTTYKNDNDEFCNGFTLGAYSGYFRNRDGSKNIQYAYNEYSAHYCLGIIYNRTQMDSKSELKKYSIDDLENIPSVINEFIFFVQEKWKIASDKAGSGNTKNIGSINKIEDILNGNGVFSKAGELIFDDYWINFGNINTVTLDGKVKEIKSLEEFLSFRGLDENLYNPKALKRKKGI